MGHSRDSKTETHEKIVEVAAKRFREAGLDGVGIADLMKDVGLTVGGFYKHFDSREDLVAEAVEAANGNWPSTVAKAEAERTSNDGLFDRLVGEYLDVAHRDDPGRGCVFGALAGDLGRSGAKTRAVATRNLERALGLLAKVFSDRRAPAARATAILVYSALVGAVSLARATNDEALSREILGTVGKALKKMRPDRLRTR
jgi:TetR/AcrR family transcriptional repressor of nem operon